MMITVRKRPRLQSVIILLTAIALISQSGCTAGVASVQYLSDIGQRDSIPAKANITVDITGNNIHWRFQEATTKRSITNTIKRDLEQNIFYGGDRIVLNVTVTVDKISFSEEQWYYLGWMVYPFYLLGMPLAKATGGAEVALRITALNGDLIGSYQTAQYLHKWYTVFTLGSVFPSTANQGGITRDALQLAMEDLKYQFLNDRLAVGLANEQAGLFPVADQRAAIRPGGYGPVADPAEKLNVAVIDLDAISISVSEAATLTNRLRVELFHTGRFVVLERAKMQEIMEEQGFQETGCTTSDCLVEVGQLLNMEQMITGSVSKFGNVYSIELRIFDVETGVIVGAAVEDITGSLSDVLTKGIRNAAVKLTH